MKKLARIFSYLFNPLLIPAYATLFYFLVTLNFFYKLEVYFVFVQILILTLLLPVSLYYLFKSLGIIKTKMLIDKNERRLPLAFYSLLLFVLIRHSLANLVLPELYYYFLGSLAATIIALALVLAGRKISLHVMGISSLTIFVISISAYYHIQVLLIIAFLILSCGLVASSRLIEREHTTSGVIAGALVGIAPQIFLWFIWLFPSPIS